MYILQVYLNNIYQVRFWHSAQRSAVCGVGAESRWHAVPPHRTQWRSGCFCTRGAIQGYDVICLFSRWQKLW